MRVLVISGIWPPDIGGPASHGPEVVEALRRRGHEVRAVTTAWEPPPDAPYPVAWASRARPVGVRHLTSAAVVTRWAAAADVLYATGGMWTRAALAATATRRPLVLKLSGDPAFERARARGWYRGELGGFADAPGPGLAALRTTRDASLRRARRLLFPSAYLAGIATAWAVDPARTAVVPNPTPVPPAGLDREAARRRLGVHGPTLVFAGRLVPAKSLEVALTALAAVDGVELIVLGDGPERGALTATAERLGVAPRVRFLGARRRPEVLEALAAADACLLSSSWENFPHGLIEALAVGTPIIATEVGGVPEIVRDGVNGLLVPPREPAALARAIGRFFGDDRLREELGRAARPSAAPFAPGPVYDRIERVLCEAAA